MRKLVMNLRDRRAMLSLPDWAVAAVKQALPAEWAVVVPDVETEGTGDGMATLEPELLRAVEGAEVYFGFGMPRKLFEAATSGPDAQLRWVHSASAGVRSVLYPEMVESAVLLTNSAGIHGPPIAESVVGMILYFARGFDYAVQAQLRRRWETEPFYRAASAVREVAGATVGILGFGGIGREVAQRARGLGMRIVATKRHPEPAPEGVELLAGDDALGQLLEASDYLVVTVPDTPETRGLLSRERLAQLRPGAVLVNVARGSVVDEEALAEALRSGRLRGAGLDVFEREPLPAESPLWELPNVLLTPHVSPVTPGFWQRETELMVENIRRYLAGEPLLNSVDKRQGY